MTAFIETFTGARVQPLAPDPSTIWIEDIAHHLSNQCRFAGATSRHYSVAEHSLRVCWLLADWGEDPDVQMWGLLHDGSEAFLVDIPTPLKETAEFLTYKDAEARMMRAICRRFNLPEKMPEIVKVADAVMLATEVRDLMPGKKEHWGKLAVKPLDIPIDCIANVKAHFLQTFYMLDTRR